ncbi:hypothetical protein Vadar_033404 [Vaccinium darrowii]|uniref:Uncharacterized protein n=1 Tax=Vaccinium darrowii TaxID=229202 RepID=A0ACB7XED7_9ERIC|nr:hypothetical protein Vadar_033404 [Vaccinium darrowii]
MAGQGNGYANGNGNGNHSPSIGNGFPPVHRTSFPHNFLFGAASAAYQVGSPMAVTETWPLIFIINLRADFADFVDLCFWEFGDRVKYWITLNEPWSFCKDGYVSGSIAPGRGTTMVTPVNSSTKDSTWSVQPSHRACTSTPLEPFDNGNPATEPYIVAHNLLLAHAAAIDIYRKNYQNNMLTDATGKNAATEKSTDAQTPPVSGTAVKPPPGVPTDSKVDIAAAERALDFMFGWFVDPVVNGDYPQSMRKYVGSRLPEFSKIESEKLKGSYDFLGVNYYTAEYVSDAANSNVEKLSYTTDPKVKYSRERDGVPIGPQAGATWIYVYPQGIFDVMMYTKKK